MSLCRAQTALSSSVSTLKKALLGKLRCVNVKTPCPTEHDLQHIDGSDVVCVSIAVPKSMLYFTPFF